MIAIVRPAGVLYYKHRLSEQSTGTSILASRASSPDFPAAACSRPPSDHALAVHIFGSAPCHTQNMHADSARSVSHHVRREHVPYQTSISVVYQEAFPVVYGKNTLFNSPLNPQSSTPKKDFLPPTSVEPTLIEHHLERGPVGPRRRT